MGWGDIRWLWLLAALVVLAALRLAWSAATRRARAGVGAGLAGSTPRVGRRRERVRAIALWSALALACIAVAGPRWGAADEARRQVGADLLLAIDCSRSMLATDLYPDRMRVARRKAMDLLHLAPETRMALLPFAGASLLRCPLTGDHQALGQILEDCDPELFPAEHGYQGTAIGAAVRQGLRLLDRQVERGQAILVISDGADPDQEAVAAAAKQAQAQGVPVYGLFIGAVDGKAEIEIDGVKRSVAAEMTSLTTLADQTGAIVVSATLDDGDVRALHEHLGAAVAQTPWEERRRIVQSERYRWPLIAAIILTTGAMLLPTRRRVAEAA
ncbi:MAG TPA: VWA domain-containing protein [Planctomycetota bacterium]|nr:VWA domain-containing protein [Planctomycetota bacterium]